IEYVFHQSIPSVSEARIDLYEICAGAQGGHRRFRAYDTADADDGEARPQFRAQLTDYAQGQWMKCSTAQPPTMLIGPSGPKAAEIGRGIRGNDAFYLERAQRRGERHHLFGGEIR